jgi:cell division protein FtsB
MTAAAAKRLFVARWWMLPVAILAVLAFFISTYYPVAKVQYRETRERTQLEAELSALKARNARLRASVDRLKTPEGVEDNARLQLGMVKKGEHVAVVIDGDETTSTALAVPDAARVDSEEAAVPTVGPWTEFLDVVFNVE